MTTHRPVHGRGANNTGYIRRVQRSSGIRYEARLRNRWLGSFETRDGAQRAIEQAKAARQECEVRT